MQYLLKRMLKFFPKKRQVDLTPRQHNLDWVKQNDTRTPEVLCKLSRRLKRDFKIESNPVYETMFGYSSMTDFRITLDEFEQCIHNLGELAQKLVVHEHNDFANDILSYVEQIKIKWDPCSIEVLDGICNEESWTGEERNHEFLYELDRSLMWLVDVESNNIVHAHDLQGEKYVAYSHRWETNENVIDTGSDIVMAYKEKKYAWKLGNKTKVKVQHMKQNTKNMGFRYMWVDLECVCQVDNNIRLKQLSSMAGIYANADVVVVYSQGSSTGNFVLNYMNASVHGRVWTLQENVVANNIHVLDEETKRCFNGMCMPIIASIIKMFMLERDRTYQRSSSSVNSDYVNNILYAAKLRSSGKVKTHKEWVLALANRRCKFEDDFAYATMGLVYFDSDITHLDIENNVPPIVKMYEKAKWKELSYTYGPGMSYAGWCHLKVPGGELHAEELTESNTLNARQEFEAIRCHNGFFKYVYNLDKVKLSIDDYEEAISEFGCRLDTQAAENSAMRDLERFSLEGPDNFIFARETSVNANPYMVSLARYQKDQASKYLVLVGENGVCAEAILYKDIQLDDTLALVPVCTHQSSMLWVRIYVIGPDDKALYVGEGAALNSYSYEYAIIRAE